MNNYIVCQKKRNNPRLDSRICAASCPLVHDCMDYKRFRQVAARQRIFDQIGEELRRRLGEDCWQELERLERRNQ